MYLMASREVAEKLRSPATYNGKRKDLCLDWRVNRLQFQSEPDVRSKRTCGYLNELLAWSCLLTAAAAAVSVRVTELSPRVCSSAVLVLCSSIC